MGPRSSGTPAPFIALQQGKRPVGSGHVSTTLAARARPVSSSRDQLLPLLPALAPLFPGGGLQRGGVVTVGTGEGTAPGRRVVEAPRWPSPSSPPPRPPSWCAAVGTADPGILAIAELGVDLDHLVLVPGPGPCGPEVAATLFDDMDVVLVGPRAGAAGGGPAAGGPGPASAGAVLVVLGARGWPEGPDVQLTVEAGAWEGVEAGHGHLRGRHVEVLASGRRPPAGPVRVGLWLPAPSGQVAAGARTPAGALGISEKEVEEAEGAAAARGVVPRDP